MIIWTNPDLLAVYHKSDKKMARFAYWRWEHKILPFISCFTGTHHLSCTSNDEAASSN